MSAWSLAQFITGSLGMVLATSEPVRAQPASPVLRIGVTATDVFAEAYYAAGMGFFKKAGLNVDVQTFSSGAIASDAVIGGSLDIGVTTPLLLANGYLRGVPFVIVAAGALNTARAPQSLLRVAKKGRFIPPKI